VKRVADWLGHWSGIYFQTYFHLHDDGGGNADFFDAVSCDDHAQTAIDYCAGKSRGIDWNPPKVVPPCGCGFSYGRRRSYPMDYYDLDSLSRALGKFEERYGLPSEDFVEAHRDDADAVLQIPGFVRSLWASIFFDVERMRGEAKGQSEFVSGVDRALALN
jgi:hypothetical protein